MIIIGLSFLSSSLNTNDCPTNLYSYISSYALLSTLLYESEESVYD